MIDKLFDKFTRAIELVLASALMLGVAISFVNVIDRYGFGESIQWADEVQIYIMIATAFLGAVVATWRNMHLRMDMLFKAFSRPVQRVIRIAEAITLTGLAGLVAYLSSSYTARMYALGKVSDGGGIPMWIPHSTVAAGFVLILVIALLRLGRLLRAGGRMPAGAEEGPP